MRLFKKILGIALLGFSLSIAASQKIMAQDEGSYVSDQEFYDDLQPYGTWVSDPQYGNVWIPDTQDDNFRPYATNGYWAQTEYGSTWVSNYPWGWATFHYGRWRYDDYYGWEWIPGHQWAPAWVSWRHGGGYYGWAPLMPGISITISFGGGYRVPDNYWVCAPERYINRPNIYNYYAPPTRVVNIIHTTTIINNTYVYNNRTYVTGPRPQEIQRVTHERVQVYKINNASRPGVGVVQNNAINIYRPAVRKSATARPARVVNAAAYKQANPNAGIGHAKTGGYNHANASRLATTARSSNPSTNVVRVNPVNNKPGQPAANNRLGGNNRPNPTAGSKQPGQRTDQTRQPGQNKPAQPAANVQRPQPGAGQPVGNNHRNKPVNDNQAQQKQAQQAQQRQQQQAQAQQKQAQQAQQRQQQQQAQAQQKQAQQAQQRQQQQQAQAQQKQAQQAQQRQQQQQAQAQQKQAQQAQQRQQQQQAQAQQKQAQQAQQRQQQQQAQAQQKQAQQTQQRQQQQQQQKMQQQRQKQQHPKPQPKPDAGQQ